MHLMTTVPPSPAESAPTDGAPTWAQTVGRDARYLLADWPVLLVAFALGCPFFFAGVGLTVIWIGLPLLVGTMLMLRGFATVERSLLSNLLGRTAPGIYQPRQGRTWASRLLSPLRDPQSWLDAAWVLVNFVVSTVTWSLTVVWLICAACVVLGPLAAVLLPVILGPDNYNGLGELLRLPYPHAADVVMNFVFGALFVVTLRPVLRGMARAQSGIARRLLCGRAESAARLDELRDSRDAGRRAESEALRRLERDIHDGPQQRLIRLTMDLARARRTVGDHPEQTREAFTTAMEQAQDTLDELRRLSRGIAPPVLVDRGLAAAISEASARSDIPVTVTSDLPPDLPDHVATAAYFVVSEALANLNKHSAATAADVSAEIAGDLLSVTVTDNGIGGAAVAKGHGLAGLEQRLQAVGGRLEVTSPIGGPTVIRAAVPMTS